MLFITLCGNIAYRTRIGRLIFVRFFIEVMIMKKSGSKNILSNIAVKSAFIVILFIAITAVFALGELTASAQVTQGQIDRLRAEKREYERQKREVQARIDAIEYEHMEEMAKKSVLDQRIELTCLEIVNINKTIEHLEILIREKEYEVVIAQNREEAQLQQYKNRVRDMEENGIVTYLELIFDSTSFSDLLARIDFIRDIMIADENTYNALQTARAETIAVKEQLEETKIETDNEKVLLEELEAELLEQLEEAHAIILKLEEDIDIERQLYEQFLEEEERVQREINAKVAELQRQQEEERKRNESQPGSSGGGGGSSGGTGTGQFMWPMNGSIVGRFLENRGNGRIHYGLDIGAAHGVNVVASGSGTVITARYNEGGLGYYVVIAHGNGITTLYGHLSSYVVSVGDNVSKGQLIGYNGSTGNATTPHVHMEVSVNGTRVDPLSMLSR